LAALASACLAGCAKPADKESDGGRTHPKHAIGGSGTEIELTSASYYLGVRDIGKFRPGRSKSDVLEDVQWRGDFLMAAEWKGKSICAIAYDVIPDGPGSKGGEVVWAIFVADKFVKFVPWQRGEMVDVPYEGTTWSRPKPVKVGDCRWLVRAAESEPVNMAGLEKDLKAKPAPPSHTDPGLTIAWLLLRPGIPAASEKDYQRNAELRDQFNASRLEIGMTESAVESVLKAKPLESGKMGARSYQIYGSNESFNIDSDYSLHFSNILVVFREGKASVIHSFPARPQWRRELGEGFTDLPASH
jgi:hypothetical protein